MMRASAVVIGPPTLSTSNHPTPRSLDTAQKQASHEVSPIGTYVLGVSNTQRMYARMSVARIEGRRTVTILSGWMEQYGRMMRSHGRLRSIASGDLTPHQMKPGTRCSISSKMRTTSRTGSRTTPRFQLTKSSSSSTRSSLFKSAPTSATERSISPSSGREQVTARPASPLRV